MTPTPVEKHFNIQRIFLKGVSLELPLGAAVFLEKSAPALNLNLQVETANMAENLFQTTIRGTLSAEGSGNTLFLLEVEQTGIFEARGLSAEELADVQDISAPAILAPYLRAQLADTLTRATLPAFYMPEINWTHIALEKRKTNASGPVPVTLH